jgi:RNA polymerase sigma-70 factor (ECF subfamily)
VSLTQGEAMRLLIANRAGLYAYIRSVVADRHLAEDALQQLSVVLLQKHAQIADPGGFLPWARRAARLEALHLVRQRHPGRLTFTDAVLDVIDRTWDRHDGAASADVLAALEGCVDKLPAESRRLLDWRFTDGLDCAAIADRLNRNVGAVYTALSRLYDRLGDCVRKRLAAGGLADA